MGNFSKSTIQEILFMKVLLKLFKLVFHCLGNHMGVGMSCFNIHVITWWFSIFFCNCEEMGICWIGQGMTWQFCERYNFFWVGSFHCLQNQVWTKMSYSDPLNCTFMLLYVLIQCRCQCCWCFLYFWTLFVYYHIHCNSQASISKCWCWRKTFSSEQCK